MKIKNTINKILNVIFPNEIKCIFCGKELPEDTLYCDECKRSGILNIGNKCTKCDTIIKEGNIICDNCRDYKHAFDRCFAPLIYDGVVRKAIISFKSDNAKYLAKPFAKLMYQRLLEENISFDYIIPVPSHKKTIKKRGYNPAQLLADELSKLTDKPVLDILIKNVITKKQKDLSFRDRQSNLENSIIVSDKKPVKNKNILIVDDIITTGATINVCAKLLTNANNIYACSIARTRIF